MTVYYCNVYYCKQGKRNIYNFERTMRCEMRREKKENVAATRDRGARRPAGERKPLAEPRLKPSRRAQSGIPRAHLTDFLSSFADAVIVGFGNSIRELFLGGKFQFRGILLLQHSEVLNFGKRRDD